MAILTKGIKLSELSSMSKAEKDRGVGELLRAAAKPTQLQIQQQQQELDSKIQYFEQLHGMSSSEMKQRLVEGEISETADVCSWLMLLKIQGRLESASKSSRA